MHSEDVRDKKCKVTVLKVLMFLYLERITGYHALFIMVKHIRNALNGADQRTKRLDQMPLEQIHGRLITIQFLAAVPCRWKLSLMFVVSILLIRNHKKYSIVSIMYHFSLAMSLETSKDSILPPTVTSLNNANSNLPIPLTAVQYTPWLR